MGRSYSMACAIVACALLLDGAACRAVAAEPATRQEALAALYSKDASERRDAVDGLGRLGQSVDAGLLLEALYDADHDVRSHAESAVWRVWSRSGDPDVDKLLAAGVEQMNDGHMGQAVETFTRVTERKPEFAEGWNKRATAYYLIGDYEQSLKDCDQVVKRNPQHFGALSGYGLIYVRLGDLEHALEYFQRALEINPNLESVQQSLELIRYKLGKDGKHDT
jgi:tetratricopeptide (TPR) repeat protein